MRFFNFIARNISYTFAVVFYTVFIGWIIALFAFFTGSSFIIFSYDKLLSLMIKWFPPAIMLSSFIHFIHFGFFTPIKIPAFIKSHRLINSAFSSNLNAADSELKSLYRHFSALPIYNFLFSVFYSFLAGAILIGLFLYEYRIAGSITEEEIRLLFKVITLASVMLIILYGISAYLLTEILTGKERAQVYNQLLENGNLVKPKAYTAIRIKFIFYAVFMVIIFLVFAVLIEKYRFYGENRLELFIVYFGISIAVCFFLMRINSNSIIKILKDIKRVTGEIASGKMAAFNRLSLDRELTSIGYDIMRMASEIDGYRKKLDSRVEHKTVEFQDLLSELQKKNEQMQKQLDMASLIQRSVIPERIDDWNELKFSIRSIEMGRIGGDFISVFLLKNDKLGIVVADISGYGIPTALVTSMAKILFSNAGGKYDSPGRILHEVNQNILAHVKTQEFLTCFMISIDDEYNVVYSNASHQKAILLRADSDEITLLDTNGPFIGGKEVSGDSFEEKSLKLKYGDRIILYTDGIPDALNQEKKNYSNKRFEDVVIQGKQLPLEEFSNYVIHDIQRFSENARIEDDITLLVIELAKDEAVDIIMKSKEFVNSHKYDEAVDMLENGLVQYPENKMILYNLAKTYFRLNKYSKAIQRIDKYLDYDRRNKYAYYIGGASYYKMTDYKFAIDYFEKALKLDSGFVNALFAQGMAYKEKGDVKQAKVIFKSVLNIDPDNKIARFELKQLSEME